MPRLRAAATGGAFPGTPGPFTTTSTSSSSSSSSVPRSTSTPASASLLTSTSDARSAARTSTPRAASASAAASPVRPSPTTSALRMEVEVVLVVDGKSAGPQDRGDDPEADHDLRLGPGLHLEVVVDRRHQEDAPAPEPEAGHLEHHGQRLDQEDPPDHEQQHLGLREDGEGTERATDRHRSGVAHEHLSRKRVEPEEADRGAGQRRAEDRQVERLHVRDCVSLARADVGKDVDRRERNERDDPRTGGEPVDAVRQVHTVGRAGKHQEDEHVPEPPQIGPDIEHGDIDRRLEILVVDGEADPDHHRAEQEQLPAAGEAERATMRQLDEVVREADRGAGERDAEDRQRRQRVLAHHEEADRGRDHDQHAAQHRRPLLDHVVLRALFPDRLPEFVPAQEPDEARPEQDRDDHRDDRGEEDAYHYASTATSASASVSSASTRAPLTSTQSPGRSSERSSSSAWSRVGAHTPP